jgi:uncharacterized protein (TIGR03000 family)
MDRHSDPAEKPDGPVAKEASSMKFSFAKTAVLVAIIAMAAATPASAARYNRGGRHRGGYYGYSGGYYGGYQGWGGGGYGYYSGYAYPQGYVAPDAYVQGPGSLTQSFYPTNAALSTTPIDIAHVRVKCPPNAQIWFDGTTTTQLGGDRLFYSPRLQSGTQYEYNVKASWNENGKPVEQTRTITVAAGRTVDLNFMAPVTK